MNGIIDKEKILLLVTTNNNLFEKIKEDAYNINQLFNNKTLLLRLIRRYWMKLKLPLYSIWFGNWKKQIHKYETVIIFDSKINIPTISWIRRFNSKIRVIYWFWNPIIKTSNPRKIKEGQCEKWSFDKGDCIKYNLKYNTTFYTDKFEIEDARNKYDIMFIGYEKGRYRVLLDFINNIEKMNLKSYYHIVQDKNYNLRNTKTISSNLYKNAISYDEVIRLVNQSKVILDIVQIGQIGITLRVMEALFFNKKIITNNKDIINYDFYCKENIFILDVDNYGELLYFVKSNYKNIKKEIIYNYEFEKWLGRFFY